MSQHNGQFTHFFIFYQFAIYFYVGSIGEESTKDMKKTLTSYNRSFWR